MYSGVSTNISIMDLGISGFDDYLIYVCFFT